MFGMEKRGEKAKKAVLIYDADCPVCSGAIEWIGENQKKGAFEFLPCRSEVRRMRFPRINEAVCMDAMQLVLPGGRVLSGEEALPEILRRLRRYHIFSDVFRLPGSETLSRAFYRWFADRRYHIAEALFPEKAKRKRKKHASGVSEKKP